MELFIFVLVVAVLILIVYISFLKMFKYAVLLMCGNDKDALSNLINKYNPYESYLVNRNIPLSILLNNKNIYSKFVKSNMLVKRIDHYISNYTSYNSDYEYMSKIEKVVDTKLNDWLEIDNKDIFLEKYSEKLYYLKIAIIIRLFTAFNNIKPGSSPNFYTNFNSIGSLNC